ncbi:MAG: hypothetical protein KBF37_06145 [Saprospiraceae bacterium]|nr:hypothetical protein [Saprospiraceae bacterium]MBP8892555.1 hypothetical protein [Saprospiraceae bacterium]MBP9209890.1 hypothetical protein [Saprospiraceae bacterium]
MQNESKLSLFIRDVCKGRTEEELQLAEENFKAYLLLVKEICNRMEVEGKEPIDFNKSD